MNNLNSLRTLSINSQYDENNQIAPIVVDVLSSINNNDLEGYKSNSEYLYGYVHGIQDLGARDEINSWFISRDIPDAL